MTRVIEAVRDLVGHIHWPVDPRDEAAEEAVRPYALSRHAQERLAAPDAPRFKADPELIFPRQR